MITEYCDLNSNGWMIGGDTRERKDEKGREAVRRGGRDRRKGRGREERRGKRSYANDVEVGGIYTNGEGQSALRAARTSDTRDRPTQCLQGQHIKGLRRFNRMRYVTASPTSLKEKLLTDSRRGEELTAQWHSSGEAASVSGKGSQLAAFVIQAI